MDAEKEAMQIFLDKYICIKELEKENYEQRLLIKQ